MKKLSLHFSVAALLCLFFLTGCLKDQCRNTYTIYRPVYKTLSQIRTAVKSEAPQAVQQPGKIYTYGRYIFWNEFNKGIHIIDNSNPAAPKNIAFLNIPGNVDLAIRNNYLYADSYSDLVVFDISNPAHAVAKKFVSNVYPERNLYYWGITTNPDSIMIVVDYTSKDTVVDCDTYYAWQNCINCSFEDTNGRIFFASAQKSNAPSIGTGGSMARFTIVNDFLYSVSHTQLSSFGLSAPADPQLSSTKNVGWNIETIFPFKDKLFIGSMSGMYIFSLSNPADPVQQSLFQHATSCDPVIADDKYAYVTLRSGTQCQGFTNQLDVLDVSNTLQPRLLKTYALTNPHGLAKDGHLLFVCDGKDGLKVYDATHVHNLQLKKTIGGLETYDVIAQNGLAIVVAKDGLYQYDYSDENNIRLLSKINNSK